jgi:hypothetical protein
MANHRIAGRIASPANLAGSPQALKLAATPNQTANQKSALMILAVMPQFAFYPDARVAGNWPYFNLPSASRREASTSISEPLTGHPPLESMCSCVAM